MYINDTIRLAQSYFPSEFSVSDMYIWCNEVSSMLVTEDRYIYKETAVHIDKDGTLLLPPGVRLEHIERIYSEKDEIPKETLIGISRSRFKAPITNKTVNVIYQSPFEPIRLVKYSGSGEITDGKIHIPDCGFVPDDMIIIQINPETDNVIITEPTAVYDITYDETQANKYILHIFEDVTNNLHGAYDNITITRYVTDKTVCEAPFDSMYTDYILAKINLYQRDTVAYNQHMASFNSRLDAYKKWLMSRLPQKRADFRNWW